MGEPNRLTGYLAAEDYLDELIAELDGAVVAVHGRLVLAAGPPRPVAWALNTWCDPVTIPIASIKQGSQALRAIQRNWSLYAFQLHRRARLVQDQLPHVAAKPLRFPDPPPAAPLGSWTLLAPDAILAAPRCTSPFPNGEVRFVEDRLAPPNRAYLKLWEALTRIGRRPQPGDLCLDLGASPGGWTWVLHGLGARVIAVDKADLDHVIASLPRVETRRQSAFAVEPAEVGAVDWLCCDVICYPERLLKLVERWLGSGSVRNLICSIKFQGPTDHAIVRRFAAVPDAAVFHLSHNKHELTFVWPAKG